MLEWPLLLGFQFILLVFCGLIYVQCLFGVVVVLVIVGFSLHMGCDYFITTGRWASYALP